VARPMSLTSKFLVGILVFVLAAAGLALAAIWQVGAWHLVFPSHHHDTVAPPLPDDLASPAILVFSKTNAFRHRDGIAGGAEVIASIARGRGWGFFHTENGAVFNASDLAHFDAVVFLNASGDVLSAAQESDFQAWLQAGGGWLGIHAAGDDSHLAWQWYRDNLVGADFTAHIMDPQFQRATVLLENQDHPVLSGLPAIWEHIEEWYSWEASPRFEGFTILATLDEDSYVPVMKFMGEERDLRMGDHPVVWSNCIGSGRSVYMAMGHRAEAFEQPQVRQLIANSLDWFIGGTSEGCPES